MSVQRTEKLLQLLLDHHVEHVIVGGVAAIAWGAAELTRDLDIVIPYTPERIAGLLNVLSPYRPKHATRPDLGTIGDLPEHLATFRMLLIETDLGRLDVLPECAPVGDYARLLSRAATMRLEDGTHAIIGLDDLIAVKDHVGRPKDRIVAAQLRAVRARMRHGAAASPEPPDSDED